MQHSLDLVRSSGGGGSGVLAPGVAFGPQALLRPLLELEEEEGVLPQDLGKALPAVGDGIPDPIILNSLPDELLGRLVGQPLGPKPLLLEALWSRYNLRQYRLGFNDKPLPMGQGCINEIIIILSSDGVINKTNAS